MKGKAPLEQTKLSYWEKVKISGVGNCLIIVIHCCLWCSTPKARWFQDHLQSARWLQKQLSHLKHGACVASTKYQWLKWN